MPISLRSAAEKLRVDRSWLRGFCDGKGVTLIPFGTSLVMSQEDFAKIEKDVAKMRRRKAKAVAA